MQHAGSMLRGLSGAVNADLKNATLYDQSGSLNIYFTCFDHGDYTYCLATYISMALFVLAVLVCCFTGFLTMFSKEERQARADAKLAKVRG